VNQELGFMMSMEITLVIMGLCTAAHAAADKAHEDTLVFSTATPLSENHLAPSAGPLVLRAAPREGTLSKAAGGGPVNPYTYANGWLSESAFGL